MVFNVVVRDRIAVNVNPDAKLVCGNPGDDIVIDFDDEWSDYPTKTARFIFNYHPVDVVFDGNTVKTPMIKNASLVKVGFFAGDLHTTTPAVILANKSILCEDGLPDDPTPDVYAQIMERLNNGGGKGGPSIIDVLELPTDDIDDTVFYRLPKGYIVCNRGLVTDNCFIVDGLPATGEPVTLDGQDINAGYYNSRDGEVYGYLPSTLASAVGIPAGWYSFAQLAPVFGVGWSGVIWKVLDCPMDGSFAFLLECNIYHHKGAWQNVTSASGSNGYVIHVPVDEIKIDGSRVLIELSESWDNFIPYLYSGGCVWLDLRGVGTYMIAAVTGAIYSNVNNCFYLYGAFDSGDGIKVIIECTCANGTWVPRG